MKTVLTFLKNIFINSKESRLRAGWRILIFFAVYIFLSKILTNISFKITGRLDRTTWEWWAARGIIVIVVSSLVVYLVRKFIDKKSFVSLGVKLDKLAVKDFLAGLTISALMIGLLFGILIFAGFIDITEIKWNSAGLPAIIEILLWFFGIGLAIGWSEELAFRGYFLQNMKEGLGLTWAVIISCVIYGVMHMSNPGSTIISGTFIALIGFVRIFGWLRTKQLWLSIGMHAGWDFCMGPVFGFLVSGMKTNSLISIHTKGSELITGGKFGPEAGLMVIPSIAFGLILMYLWTKGRNVVPTKK